MNTYRMHALASLLLIAVALAPVLLSGNASAHDSNEPTRAAITPGRVLQVGSTRLLRSPSAAAAVARDGDTIEIDAEEYRGDVAVWSRDRIVIRAVGGRARLVAAGASAEGKAIWVVRSKYLVVENIDFIGARVPGRNGAGIRFERGHLVVRNCGFLDNENGILTANEVDAQLEIEASEFGNNGHGDGYSHNLYVGMIARLTVTASYFHHARVGHLLKSRAAESHILYNRLTDEVGGSASYELEFPSGGVAHVLGNIIEQGRRTSNAVLVSYGAEGYHWPRNELLLVNNTLIDNHALGGVFLAARRGNRRLVTANNLLVGLGSLEEAGVGEHSNNFNARPEDFVDPLGFDYRLQPKSQLVGRGARAVSEHGTPLVPVREYWHRAGLQLVPQAAGFQPGAMQSVGLMP